MSLGHPAYETHKNRADVPRLGLSGDSVGAEKEKEN